MRLIVVEETENRQRSAQLAVRNAVQCPMLGSVSLTVCGVRRQRKCFWTVTGQAWKDKSRQNSARLTVPTLPDPQSVLSRSCWLLRRRLPLAGHGSSRRSRAVLHADQEDDWDAALSEEEDQSDGWHNIARHGTR